MQLSQPCHNQHRKSDDYLLSLQTKLSLKGTANEQNLYPSSRQNDYDILFAQATQDQEFNQLFNNSFHQNQNFSEIGEKDFEEDSLFNAQEGGCFHEGSIKQNTIKQESLFNAPLKELPIYIKKQQCSNEQKFSSMDRRTKILQILKMKDRQNKINSNKSKDSQRESISHTRQSSKSLVLKPRLQSQRSKDMQSHSAIKFAKRILDETSGIANRIKTESNQPTNTFYCHANQICRTDYDDLNDQKNIFGMISEEKDSLQCTFKPTVLKECLLSINHNNANHPPIRKSYQKNTKSQSQKATNSHSLKAKNNEKQQKSQQAPPLKVGLNKKSSIHASGSTLDVATRNQLWLIQREQKLTLKRKEQEEQKLKQQDFSFKPAINLYRKEQKGSTKPNDKDIVPPFFQRLSMAKRKNTGIKFKKEENANTRNTDIVQRQKNKENILAIVNNEKDSSQAMKQKKQRYQEAVKELHHKIMKMNL